jgi:2-oxoglutarate ferredoxin oxidoreductase subunit gamma
MRGGTANCTVVLSEEIVGSPIVDAPDALIALNLPSLDKFEASIAPEGAIVVNESLIDRKVERSDVKASYLKVNEIAAQVGSAKAVNMVALGAYLKATGIIPLDVAKQAMAQMMEDSGKGKFIPMNEKALEEGYNAV